MTILSEAALPVLAECLHQTLENQNEDGSWGDLGPVEETCYALLLLASLQTIAFAVETFAQLRRAIERARSYLRSTASAIEYLWIEKVTYRSSFLASAYRLAALEFPSQPPLVTQRAKTLWDEMESKSKSLVKSRTLMSELTSWKICEYKERTATSRVCRVGYVGHQS